MMHRKMGKMKKLNASKRMLSASTVLALSLMFSACDQIQDGLDGQLGETTTTTTETEVVTDNNDTVARDTSSSTVDNNDLRTSTTTTDTSGTTDTTVSRSTRFEPTDSTPGAPAEKDMVDGATKAQNQLDQQDADKTGDITRLTLMEQELSTFHQLVTLAGLEDTLKTGQYTVLAPNNLAFIQVPKAQMDELRQNKEKLRQVLMYHLIKNPISSTDLSKLTQAQTLSSGRKLSIVKDAKTGRALVQQARLVKPDMWATNGMVHVIDKVLIPAELKS